MSYALAGRFLTTQPPGGLRSLFLHTVLSHCLVSLFQPAGFLLLFLAGRSNGHKFPLVFAYLETSLFSPHFCRSVLPNISYLVGSFFF